MTRFFVRRPWLGPLFISEREVSERVFRRLQRSRAALCSYSLERFPAFAARSLDLIVELRAPSL